MYLCTYVCWHNSARRLPIVFPPPQSPATVICLSYFVITISSALIEKRKQVRTKRMTYIVYRTRLKYRVLGSCSLPALVERFASTFAAHRSYRDYVPVIFPSKTYTAPLSKTTCVKCIFFYGF